MPIAQNQTGCFPGGPKLAAFAHPGPGPFSWRLLDPQGRPVPGASGLTLPPVDDRASGDRVHRVDFTSWRKPGVWILEVAGDRGQPFAVDPSWVHDLARDALAYFTRSRSGVDLMADLVGAAFARPAGHRSDRAVGVARGPEGQGPALEGPIDGWGGWYDAGDYGKYVVNGGIAVWTLQNLEERSPGALAGLKEEARWELEFLLRMQISAPGDLQGLVFHKLHDRVWSSLPAALPEEDPDRLVFPPSTAATLNLAAVAAQGARLWAHDDPAFADRCRSAALGAWEAAVRHPDLLAPAWPTTGGGEYDDLRVDDEFFWAACELWRTTGEPRFLETLRGSPWAQTFLGSQPGEFTSLTWADTAALGVLSLLEDPAGTPAEVLTPLREGLVAAADRYLAASQTQGYPVPMEPEGYIWGSSALVLNNALVLARAAELCRDSGRAAAYRDAVVGALDALLGANALGQSYITGYGTKAAEHPHHRLWANEPEAGWGPPPPGVVVGGPNARRQDPDLQALPPGTPPARCYLDVRGSYAGNEVAINWNAPLVWVAAWLGAREDLTRT